MCHTKQAYEAVIIHTIYTSEETETESIPRLSQAPWTVSNCPSSTPDVFFLPQPFTILQRSFLTALEKFLSTKTSRKRLPTFFIFNVVNSLYVSLSQKHWHLCRILIQSVPTCMSILSFCHLCSGRPASHEVTNTLDEDVTTAWQAKNGKKLNVYQK